VRLRNVLNTAIERLTSATVPSPRMNAELLMMFVLGCDRAYLYAHPERELTEDGQKQYDRAVAERARGVPAQYITGHQEFWGMDFIVTPAVLIPRPETEHVIEEVLDLAKSGGQECPPHTIQANPPFRIADVGTGSGCIALALAKELPTAEIHAIELSSSALEIARGNAARHQMESRIRFHHGDLLAGLEKDYFDFVVSNPPYVGESEADQVQLEVRKFEPRNAVFAGDKGTEVIERLIPQAQTALKPGGWLVMEVSETIAKGVESLLQGWHEVRTLPDLQSIPRVVRARKS
jgi:release factor glutamine methyltransferase